MAVDERARAGLFLGVQYPSDNLPVLRMQNL